MNYKVKQEDLNGDIKDFPIEVVQKMVDEQVRQGNKADVGVFHNCNYTTKNRGGFDWKDSDDKGCFWNEVISLKNIGAFFSKYPKQSDLKEDNSKCDKVVVKEKKVIKRTFKKLSEVKLLVTNRDRKAVIAFLDEVCEKRWTPSHLESELLTKDTKVMLFFDGNDVNDWAMCNGDFYTGSEIERVFVKLRDIKRIYAREENRKQRELEKSKLFCETVKENVSHAESEVKKVYVNPFFTNESIEKIKEFIEKVSEIKNRIGEPINLGERINTEGIKKLAEDTNIKTSSIAYLTSHNNTLKSRLDREIKTNEELSKMLYGKIEVLGKREGQLDTVEIKNAELRVSNNKLRDYNDALVFRVSKEKLFKNIFLVMFLISFLTLVAISLKY